jgi:hypothetical protein
MSELLEPRLEQILAFCAREPVERVFLEDVALRSATSARTSCPQATAATAFRVASSGRVRG